MTSYNVGSWNSATETGTCSSSTVYTNRKRVIFGICMSMPLLLYIIYPRSASPSAELIDTSGRHVAELIERWQQERTQRKYDVITEDSKSRLEGRNNFERRQASRKISDPRKSFIADRVAKGYFYKSKRSPQKIDRRYDDLLQNILKAQNGSTAQPIYKIYALEKVISDEFECLELKVRPTTPVCIYDPQIDVFLSKEIKANGIWEKHIVSLIQNILRADQTIGLIDVGANIGQYSLIAARMGHPVLAVEPWLGNLRRFNKAINIGGLSEKITILQNAISDRRSTRCLVMNANNQGDIRVSEKNATDGRNVNCFMTGTVLLDDLIPFANFRKALLKVDIQGYEHLAFLHVEKLLDEVYIPYIFIEWVLLRELWVTRFHASLDKTVVNRMVALLVRREYRVFSAASGRELDTKYWHGWPEDVVWKHKLVLSN